MEDVTSSQGTEGTGAGTTIAKGTAFSAVVILVVFVARGAHCVGHHQVGYVFLTAAGIRQTVAAGPTGGTKDVLRAVRTISLRLAAVSVWTFHYIVLSRLEVVKDETWRVGRLGLKCPLVTQMSRLNVVGAGGALVLPAGVKCSSFGLHLFVAEGALVVRLTETEMTRGSGKSVSLKTGVAATYHIAVGTLDLVYDRALVTFAGRTTGRTLVLAPSSVGLQTVFAEVRVAEKVIETMAS